MKKILFILVSLLILGGLCSLWDSESNSRARKELYDLKVTAENVSPTKATLRFTHPNPSILKKYSIEDDCYFILKENGNKPSYLESVKYKEGGSLTINADSTVTYDKSWEHLYGELEPGEYVLGIFISKQSFFKTRILRSIHVDIQIPEI